MKEIFCGLEDHAYLDCCCCFLSSLAAHVDNWYRRKQEGFLMFGIARASITCEGGIDIVLLQASAVLLLWQ